MYVGVVAATATRGAVGVGDELGEFVDRRVREDRLDALERGDAAESAHHASPRSVSSSPSRSVAAARSRLRMPSARATASI